MARRRWRAAPAGAPVTPSSGPSAALSSAPCLQRNVRPALKKLPLRAWLDRLELIERQVCRVEANGAAIGTGFLVGPRAVLTNWHVVREARNRSVMGDLLCRFDYNQLASGATQAGETCKVADVVAESPFSPAELTATPDTPPPKPDELDYALLTIASQVAARGFIALVEPPPVAAADFGQAQDHARQ